MTTVWKILSYEFISLFSSDLAISISFTSIIDWCIYINLWFDPNQFLLAYAIPSNILTFWYQKLAGAKNDIDGNTNNCDAETILRKVIHLIIFLAYVEINRILKYLNSIGHYKYCIKVWMWWRYFA